MVFWSKRDFSVIGKISNFLNFRIKTIHERIEQSAARYDIKDKSDFFVRLNRKELVLIMRLFKKINTQL